MIDSFRVGKKEVRECQEITASDDEGGSEFRHLSLFFGPIF
jgi:hypothetical protein